MSVLASVEVDGGPERPVRPVGWGEARTTMKWRPSVKKVINTVALVIRWLAKELSCLTSVTQPYDLEPGATVAQFPQRRHFSHKFTFPSFCTFRWWFYFFHFLLIRSHSSRFSSRFFQDSFSINPRESSDQTTSCHHFKRFFFFKICKWLHIARIDVAASLHFKIPGMYDDLKIQIFWWVRFCIIKAK